MNRAIVARILWCVVVSFWFVATGFAQGTTLLVDNFDGDRNQLEGYRNTFQKPPSTAVAARVAGARSGHAGLSLRLTADRKEAGYCGFWIHFFNVRASQHQYVDAANFECLCFWVKGAVGGERFTIKLADDAWIAKEDSVAVGEIGEFLAAGVTTSWQQVRIPLHAKLGLNLHRLGGLTLDFETRGQCTVFIDNVTFESGRPSKRHSVAAVTSPRTSADATAAHLDRAVLLSRTKAMLDDPSASNRFFRFCKERGITQVWAQLPYQLKATRKGSQVTNRECVIQRQRELGRFINAAHSEGLAVHAMDGCPEYVQRQYHYVPLAVVDAVLAFNQGQHAGAQFDGIHFNNQPQLLVGWHDPQRRKQILYEFLTLNSECQLRVKKVLPRIEFGAEIPSYLHFSDHRDESECVVSFRGIRQPVALHLIEMLDHVGMTNHGDSARGTEGMMTSARDLLAHPDGSTGAKVLVGLDPSVSQPTRVVFAVGRPRPQFSQAVHGGGAELATLSRLDGNRLHVVDDGVHLHVGIEVTETDSIAERIKIARTISRLASAFGVAADGDQELASRFQDQLAKKLVQEEQWSSVRPCRVRDPDTGRVHLLVSADSIATGKMPLVDETANRSVSQTSLASTDRTLVQDQK